MLRHKEAIDDRKMLVRFVSFVILKYLRERVWLTARARDGHLVTNAAWSFGYEDE